MNFRFTIIRGLLTVLLALNVHAQQVDLELVAEVETAPGNIAVTPEGRIIMSAFGGYRPQWKLVELVDGEQVPYPSEAWASAPEEGSNVGVNSVLGLRSDPNGVVWFLDHGSRGRTQAQLIAWDTRNESLHKQILIDSPFGGNGIFLNDLAVDAERGVVFVAVVSAPSHILIIDTNTEQMRKVLVDHESVRTELVPVVLDGRVLGSYNAEGDVEARHGGLNPITIDSKHEYVYYGAMTGGSLYRVAVEDLLDESLSDEELAGRVERYGDKSPSAGITMDDGGNVYITDLGARGIGVTNANGEYSLLVSDQRIEWPDGMAAGPDNYIYFNTNQQNRGTDTHEVEGGTAAPFHLFRFKALSPTSPGR